MAHTPGPWEVDATYPTDVLSGDLQICDCDFMQGVLTDEETSANARLIAAAYASGQAYDKCPLGIVKAAIAKAKGE